MVRQVYRRPIIAAILAVFLTHSLVGNPSNLGVPGDGLAFDPTLLWGVEGLALHPPPGCMFNGRGKLGHGAFYCGPNVFH